MSEAGFGGSVEQLAAEVRSVMASVGALDPLRTTDLHVLIGADISGVWEGGPPDAVVRLVYSSGHGGESAHMLQRDAALWRGPGGLTRMVLEDTGGASRDVSVPTGEEGAAWASVREFLVDALG